MAEKKTANKKPAAKKAPAKTTVKAPAKKAAPKSEKKEMATIYIFGKKYDVPAELTIMNAMEYAGYQLKRGCGCRNGFCGACATIYRIKGQNQLQTCLACSKKVENDMYIATLPFFPLVKQIYDINKIKPEQQIMMQLYPEIYSCVGCNACTRACPQSLQTMQYIAYAQRGDFAKCADLSFDCVMCGCCSSRCPAGISHPQVAELARRINGKYIQPEAQHLLDRVAEIDSGACEEAIQKFVAMSTGDKEQIKNLYNNRDIEK